MYDVASSFLAPWANFYVMVGSAAAGLTGLMFVVITLVMNTERTKRAPDGISVFSTPTVVHFGAVLLVAAILGAPWKVLLHPAILLALVGLGGIIYQARIIHRTTKLEFYDPDAEDWTWHSILPFVSYIVTFAGSLFLAQHPIEALFAFAGSSVLLIFVGIHNAWDIVTYIAIGTPEEPPKTP